MKRVHCVLSFLFFGLCSAVSANAYETRSNANMNITIGNEYVGINQIEKKYLAYTKIKEAEKTLNRLKQSTSTNEFLRKSTTEQRDEIGKKILELEGVLSSINEDNVTEKDYVKIHVKLQSIIDEIEMIDNIADYTYGFAPKFIVKTGILASSKYVFLAPIAFDMNLYYQLNRFVNPFIGIGFTVPVLLNHRNDILTSGYSVRKYAVLVETKFGNLFKIHKDHYVSLFLKIGSLLGHQSDNIDKQTMEYGMLKTKTEKVVIKTNPLGDSIITGLGFEYFFKNKLVLGLNFDIYNASSGSPVNKKTNFVLGVNVGYNFCSGNKSHFSTNSSGKTKIYKTMWE